MPWFLILMKKILIALAVLAFGASALLQQARGQDVSVDYFYDNLSGGNWIDVEDYGYGWQPDVAVNDQNWRPYADGYWAYTDDGWTWISYEDFGWATYHYGRWANLSDYGWVWFPGDDLDWGPAWVSWRTGGDYVGWAPLPPRGRGVVYEGGYIGPQVDIQFDIGPAYYNFIPVRYIGEPLLRNYIVPPVQNVTYINNTVNITNINVRNNVVYNYGPDYNALAAQSARPIQRLNIERQSAVNLSEAVKAGALTKVQGNKLVVAAPPKLAPPRPNAKPLAVKATVPPTKINRGWAGVPNEAQLKQKIKTENPKNVPPPTRAVARPGGSPPRAVAVSPETRAAGALPVPPGTKAKPGRVMPGSTAEPATSLGADREERAKQQGKRPGEMAGAAEGGSKASKERQAGQLDMQAERNKQSIERGKPVSPPLGQTGASPDKPTFGEKFKPAPSEQRSAALKAPDITRRGGAQGGQPGYRQPGAPPTGAGPGEGPGVKEPGQSAVNKPPPAGTGPGERRGAKERGQLNKPPVSPPAAAGQGAYGQPGGPPRGRAPAAAERAPGQPERGKKKGEGTPAPRP